VLVVTYPTKKALKESVGKPLKYVETSFFGAEFKSNGTFSVVGPSAYNRKWWATITMKDNLIAKVE